MWKVCQFVRMQQICSQLRIFMKFNIWHFFSKMFRENSSFAKIWQEWWVLYTKKEPCTFMIKCRWSILKMRNISDKSFRENRNPRLCSITFFLRAYLYVIMWKSIIESYSPQMTARRLRFAAYRICNTYCFPRNQWLHEHT